MALTAAWAPGSAQAASCSKIKENQQVRLVGQVVEDRFTETYSGGGAPRTSNHKITRFGMGNLTIKATTCLSAGRWRVLDPVVVSPTYANIGSDGTVPFGATGWGLAPWQVRDRSLALRSVECRSGKLWTGVRGLLGVPLPVRYVVSLTQFVTSQVGGSVIPQDKTSCAQIAASTVRFRFNRRGTLSLKPIKASRTYLITDYGDFKLKKTLTVTAQQG